MPAIKVIIHPLLFAAFPVLFLFARNKGALPLNVIFAPLAATAILSLTAYTLIKILLKDRKKAGLITSVFFILFFSYGHIHQFFGIADPILLACFTAVFLSSTYYLVKAKDGIGFLTSLFNVTASLLVAFSIADIGLYELAGLSAKHRNAPVVENARPVPKTSMPASMPDIYFIVVDAYAGPDVLKELYGYDNSEFLDYLKGKGFYIAGKAAANYCQTGLSLASNLNLRYLDDLAGMDSDNVKPLKFMIQDSVVFNFLRQRGYKIMAFSSGRYETEIENADIYMGGGWAPDEFQNSIISTTPIPGILKMIKAPDQFDMHRSRILYTFRHLPDAADIKGPVFVFAHIEAPHPPFVFGRNGEAVKTDIMFREHDGDWLVRKGRLSRDQYVKYYVDQLIFVNARLKTAVETILARSDTPPIIILESDHGPRSMLYWSEPEKTNFEECMSILSAYYLPADGAGYLHEDMTPVNTFRVIFNRYFGTGYEILEDKNFFSTAGHPYKFIDVTDSVRKHPR